MINVESSVESVKSFDDLIYGVYAKMNISNESNYLDVLTNDDFNDGRDYLILGSSDKGYFEDYSDILEQYRKCTIIVIRLENVLNTNKTVYFYYLLNLSNEKDFINKDLVFLYSKTGNKKSYDNDIEAYGVETLDYVCGRAYNGKYTAAIICELSSSRSFSSISLAVYDETNFTF